MPDLDHDLVDSSNKIYVTWDTPNTGVDEVDATDVTEKRIAYVCGDFGYSESDSLTQVADKLFQSLSGEYTLSAPVFGPTPIWKFHDASSDPSIASECPGLALYVGVHFEMLGLGAGNIRYCHAKPDGTYTYSSSIFTVVRRFQGSEHDSATTHFDYSLAEQFTHVDGSGNPNNFEAAWYFDSNYYALGVSSSTEYKFADAEGVVDAAFESIEWQYYTSGSPTYTVAECLEAPWEEAAP